MAKVDWKRILCPIDFSDASRAALETAAELAKQHQGKLTLLHAYPVPGYTFPDGSFVASSKMLEELAEAARIHLEEWKGIATSLGLSDVQAVTAVGEPAAEILTYAGEQGVDLLVVGTHGRTGLTHARMGSVAERVVRKAPCPVLTVRPPKA